MRILVVEDDAELCAALSETLTDEGHEVTVAFDGLQAMACLQAGGPPDLILLDLMLPFLSGWQLVAALGAGGRELPCPIVVLSTVGHLAPKEAAATLQKPVQIPPLLAAIGRCGRGALVPEVRSA